MGFFSDLGKKTTETTGKIAKETKLKMKINDNKGKITDIYEEIGKKVYEKHLREENIDIKTELEEECTKIDVLSAEIETCLKSILELKEKKQCEQCHAEIDLNDAFCSKCGAKQPEIEVKDAEVIKDELENADINPENETEKKIVEEDVSGTNVTSPEIETSKDTVNQQQNDNNQSEKETEQQLEEAENNLEKVTEIMAVKTQEDAKESNIGE